ncbi:major facilitator superfamily domain-containing protein [Phlyctochytrium arcticum]|nr:major facilitator superfamily domain-containing protein [Phlyctochytrium arcticum]
MAHPATDRTPLIHSDTHNPRYSTWRKLVLFLLVTAYTGYYFCRTNLPLAIPDLEDKLLDRSQVSYILATGYVVFLVGKFMSGFFVDHFGGKTTLLLGLVGSIATSSLFPSKVSPVWFAVLRGLNQLCSSVGWGACVKTVRGWYPPSRAAHAIAVASLAETLGDALVRVVLGLSLASGMTWDKMFYVSAIAGAVLFIPACFIPGTPEDKGFESPEEKDMDARDAMRNRSVYSDQESSSGLGPILKSPRIWLLSFELLGVILIRESFASFVSSLIASELHLSPGKAAISSAIFPAMGAISALAGGLLLDHTRQTRRAAVPFISLTLLTVSLGGMVAVTPSSSSASEISTPQMMLFLGMIALVSLFLFAPKIIFDGAFVMDLAGGPESVGTVTAFVTGVGYLGGCLSPFVSGAVADRMGWPVAILGLVGVGGMSTVASVGYWVLDLRTLRDNDDGDQDQDGRA